MRVFFALERIWKYGCPDCVACFCEKKAHTDCAEVWFTGSIYRGLNVVVVVHGCLLLIIQGLVRDAVFPFRDYWITYHLYESSSEIEDASK